MHVTWNDQEINVTISTQEIQSCRKGIICSDMYDFFRSSVDIFQSKAGGSVIQCRCNTGTVRVDTRFLDEEDAIVFWGIFCTFMNKYHNRDMIKEHNRFRMDIAQTMLLLGDHGQPPISTLV